MTITIMPMDATAGAPAYTAMAYRQANAANAMVGSDTFGTRSGWRLGTPTTILTATSTAWTLQPCSAVLSPNAVQYQGAYGWATSTPVTGTVTAADATNPRLDIVYIQVNDSSAGDGSGALTAPVNYLAGTPAPTPTAPALPARSFLVGTISVPKVGAGSPSVIFNNTVTTAAGGVVPVANTAARDALTPYVGLTVSRLDAGGWLQICTGIGPTTWQGVGPYAQASGYASVPSVAAGGTAGVVATFPAGRFSQPPVISMLSESFRLTCATSVPTATSASLVVFNGTGNATGATVRIHWTAVQMTDTSAAG